MKSPLSMRIWIPKVSWANASLSPKRHLDRFIRFCTARPYSEHTQTTLRATCVGKGRVRALDAGDAAR